MKEYASDYSRILVTDEIKQIVTKIWTAAQMLYFSTRVPVVHILKAIRGFVSRRFIYERSVANIRDWSLAYSFICLKKTEQLFSPLNILSLKIWVISECGTNLKPDHLGTVFLTLN